MVVFPGEGGGGPMAGWVILRLNETDASSGLPGDDVLAAVI